MYKLPIKKLKEFKVGIIYLYGSVAQGYESKLSDIDIGVVFVDPKVLENSLEVYNRLYDIFDEAIKPKEEIDLVFLQQTSLGLQYNVINEGKVIYAVSPEFRADYEEKVLNKYLDFEPVSDYFDECLMRRLR